MLILLRVPGAVQGRFHEKKLVPKVAARVQLADNTKVQNKPYKSLRKKMEKNTYKKKTSE